MAETSSAYGVEIEAARGYRAGAFVMPWLRTMRDERFAILMPFSGDVSGAAACA